MKTEKNGKSLNISMILMFTYLKTFAMYIDNKEEKYIHLSDIWVTFFLTSIFITSVMVLG